MHVVAVGVQRAGREGEVGRAGGRAAEEGAVEPGRERLRGRRPESDTRWTPVSRAGAAEPAAVPGVAGVEAVVVGVQHRQRGDAGDAVGGHLVGHLPAGVVEAGARPPVTPRAYFQLVELGQRHLRRGRDGAEQAAGFGLRSGDRLAVPGDPIRRGEHLDGGVGRRCRRSVRGCRRELVAVRSRWVPRTSTGPAAVSCRQNVSAVGLSASSSSSGRAPAAGDRDAAQAGVRVVQPQVAGGGVPGGGDTAAGHLSGVTA